MSVGQELAGWALCRLIGHRWVPAEVRLDVADHGKGKIQPTPYKCDRCGERRTSR